MLKNISPIGSAGSYTLVRAHLHPTGDQASAIARASGTHRAKRSNWARPGCRGADGREGLIQAGPGAPGAGQAAIHIDPLRCDPEGFLEHRPLDGEVLLVSVEQRA